MIGNIDRKKIEEFRCSRLLYDGICPRKVK